MMLKSFFEKLGWRDEPPARQPQNDEDQNAPPYSSKMHAIPPPPSGAGIEDSYVKELGNLKPLTVPDASRGKKKPGTIAELREAIKKDAMNPINPEAFNAQLSVPESLRVEDIDILCTKINDLLHDPLPDNLPPGVKKRWITTAGAKSELPNLRQAFAAADLIYLGDIPPSVQEVFDLIVDAYQFSDVTTGTIYTFLCQLKQKLGIAFGKKNGWDETVQRKFKDFKERNVEQTEDLPIKNLLTPIWELLKEFEDNLKEIMFLIQLDKMGCSVIGHFIQLTADDLKHCEPQSKYEDIIAALLQKLKEQGMHLETKLPSDTKKTLLDTKLPLPTMETIKRQKKAT